MKKPKERNVEVIALLVLLGALAVVPAFFQGSVSPRFYLPLNLGAALLLGVWAAFFFLRREAVFYKTPVYPLLALFLYLSLVTVTTSIYPEASWAQFFKITSAAIVFLVVTTAAASGMFEREELDVLQVTILAGGFVIACFSILAPITFLEGDPLRFYPFVNRNHLAGYLSLTLPMALAFYFNSRRTEFKLVAVGAFFLMLVAMVMSLSRGGVVSFALALCFLIYLYFFHIRESRRRFVTWVIVPILVAAALLVLDFDPLIRKFEEKPIFGERVGASAAERKILYLDTLRLVAERPILGHGPGTFFHTFQRYRTPELWGQPYYAHNDYLELLVDSGVLGLGLAVAILYFGMRFFFRTLSVRRDSQKKILAACCATGVVAILLHGLVDFNLRIPSNLTLFALVGALALTYIGLPSGAGRTSPYPELVRVPLTRFRRVFFLSAVGLYIVLCSYYSITRLLADARFRAGEEFLQSGQLSQAYYEFSKAADLVPGNADYHYKKGIAYFLAAGEGERPPKGPRREMTQARQTFNIAIREIQEAAALNPRDSRYVLDLAGILDKNKVEGLFEPLAVKALALEPGNPYIHRTLGLRFLQMGKIDQGLWHLRRTAALLPKLIDEPTIQAAWALVPDTRRLMQGFATDAGALGRFGAFAVKMGEDPIAIEAFRDAVGMDPEQRGLYVQLAELLTRSNRLDEARQVAQRMLERWEKEAPGYRLMADAYLAGGEKKAAEEFLKKAVELEPKDPQNFPRLVALYHESGRVDELIAFLKGIMTARKDCLGEVNYHLARAYEEKDEWLLALNYAKKAGQCDSENLRYALFMMDLYAKREMYYEASTVVERVRGSLKEDPRVLAKLGTIYEAWEKPSKACEVYTRLQHQEPNNVEYRRKVETFCR